MKKTILCSLLTILFFATAKQKSVASHVATMEITYRHISGTTYEFTAILYRNCFGLLAPFSIPLSVSSLSRAVNNTNAVTLNRLPISGTGVPPLNPPNLFNCTAATLCFEEYEYRGTLDLSTLTPTGQASDWVFSVQNCCRSTGTAAADNINPGWLYTECGLNNFDFPAGNDAPFWHERRPIRPGHLTQTVINYPITSICVDNQVVVKQNAVEYEGDLVKYEWIVPLDMNGTPATYVSGYSFSYPLPHHIPSGLKIDSLTGEVKLRTVAPAAPTTPPDIFVLAIKATEYRMVGGIPKEIAHVIRHYTVIIEPTATCPGSNIGFTSKQKNVACNDTSFEIEINEFFQCATADSNASFLSLADSTSGAIIPLHSVNVTNCLNNLIGTKFDVNLTAPLPAGTYFLTLKAGTDGNTILSECNSEIPSGQDTVVITVDSVDAPLLLGSDDGVGGNFPYVIGECGSSSLNAVFNIPVKCSSIDLLGTDFLLIDSSGTAPSINVITSVTPTGCIDGLTDGVTVNFTTPLHAGNYGLLLKQGTDGNTIQNKCGEASAPGTIQIQVPEISVDLGPDLTYVQGSTFQALLDAGPGLNYLWSTGDTVQQIIVTGAGTYFVTVDNGHGCMASDTMVVDVIIGIEEAWENDISLYPNPSSGIIYIQNEGGAKALQVTVLDMKGNEIYNAIQEMNAFSKQQIDLSGHNAGVYFVQLKENEQLLKTEKIVIE